MKLVTVRELKEMEKAMANGQAEKKRLPNFTMFGKHKSRNHEITPGPGEHWTTFDQGQLTTMASMQ